MGSLIVREKGGNSLEDLLIFTGRNSYMLPFLHILIYVKISKVDSLQFSKEYA